MGAPRWGKALLIFAGLASAGVLVAPRAGELPAGVAALAAAHPGWVLAAAGAAAVAYAAPAVALQAVVAAQLPMWRTVQVQVAGASAAIVAPAGLGGMALNVRYLQRLGLSRAEALAAVGLHRIAAAVVHVTTLVLLAPYLVGQLGLLGAGSLPVAGAGVGVLVVCAAAAAMLASRRFVPSVDRLVARVPAAAATLASGVGLVARCWRRSLGLVGGSVLLSAARALTLAACLQALGASAPLLTVIAVYLGAEALGALGGTPGGLGLLDSALVAGLATAEVAAASAIAAVLIFRLLTFWLPTAPGALALRQLRRAAVI